jgi:hypothetical protein
MSIGEGDGLLSATAEVRLCSSDGWTSDFSDEREQEVDSEYVSGGAERGLGDMGSAKNLCSIVG